VTVLALVLGAVALVVAVLALVLAFTVMKQSGEVTAEIRQHRRAHTIAFGHADPKLDRRQVALGPPRATGERRGASRYEPPRDRLMPRPEPLDGEPTGELERTEQPTTMLEAQRPDVPRRQQ
jgi:hypothetical protein